MSRLEYKVTTERSYHKEYIYVKYQSSNTHYSKVNSKIKVFKKLIKLQGHNCWYPRADLVS